MVYINSFVFAIDVTDVIDNVWLPQRNFGGRPAVMRRVTPAPSVPTSAGRSDEDHGSDRCAVPHSGGSCAARPPHGSERLAKHKKSK